MRKLGAGLVILGLAALPASAQEPWDTSFALFGGQVSGAAEAYLGQDHSLGVSAQGAYPLTRRSAVVFEGGYRYLPTTTVMVGGSTLEYKSDGYFGGISYRHILFDAFYAQAGVRGGQMRSQVRARDYTSSLDHDKGARTVGFAPQFGLGYRFNEKYALEAVASSLSIQTLAGVTKRLPTVDAALVIHFGK